MRFEQPIYLMLLVLIPLYVVLLSYFLRRRATFLQSLNAVYTTDTWLPPWSLKQFRLSQMLLCLAMFFGIIALANPQWGVRSKTSETKSVDVFLALDISNSMLAQDIGPNRLERSKKLLNDLAAAIGGNRIGLIYFAGDAFLQMPLTQDLAAINIALQTASTDQVASQGTAIGAAIDLAFRASDEDDGKQKALILVTDGEDHDDDAVSKVKSAASKGWIVGVVGAGTTQGGPIPMSGGGFLKDDQGKVVHTALNAELIQSLADAGNGIAVDINEGNGGVEKLANLINGLEKSKGKATVYMEYQSFFPWFLALAIMALLGVFALHRNLIKV